MGRVRDRRAAAASRAAPEGRVDTFIRGLLSGALVGAAIAGSAIWERRRRKQTAKLEETAGTGRPGSAGDGAAPAAPETTSGS